MVDSALLQGTRRTRSETAVNSSLLGGRHGNDPLSNPAGASAVRPLPLPLLSRLSVALVDLRW